MESESPRPVRVPLSTLLKDLRRARGYTQRELAARAHVSERAIQNLERGHTTAPQLYTVTQLAKALEASDDQLAALREAARDDLDNRPSTDPEAALDVMKEPDRGPSPQERFSRSRVWAALLIGLVFLALLVTGGLIGWRMWSSRAASALVVIDAPQDRSIVPGTFEAEGRASVPTGYELWLLVRPHAGSPEYVTATSVPIRVDVGGNWVARVTIGRGPKDAGYEFDLVAVLSPVGGGVGRYVKLLPSGKKYAHLATVPDDCDDVTRIVVSRAH